MRRSKALAQNQKDRAGNNEPDSCNGKPDAQGASWWINGSSCREYEKADHIDRGRPVDNAMAEPVRHMETQREDNEHGSYAEREASCARQLGHGFSCG